MSNNNFLLELKQQIQEASTKVSQLEGTKKALLSQLKQDWNCKTLEQAKEKLTKLKKQAEETQKKIDTGIAELEEKYELD